VCDPRAEYECNAMNGNADELIVADIGGTNGRFALASRAGAGWRLDSVRVFASPEVEDMAALLRRYLETLAGRAPRQACLAIAGPVDGNRGHLTNLGWTADGGELQAHCGLERVQLVNDFAALAAAAPHLDDTDLHEVVAGAGRPGRPVSVLGPGTGLGVTLLLPHGDAWQVVPTEGGHVGFAPRNELEQAYLGHLHQRMSHVSAEYVLCGEGLARLHAFLRLHADASPRELRPAQISAAALEDSDPYCSATLRHYLGMLGSFAGDVALVHGAGGVFLGGGVLPRLQPLLAGSDFQGRFVDKGPMSSYVEGMPVRLITAGDAALQGAARLYEFPAA
jgi:glucokinase